VKRVVSDSEVLGKYDLCVKYTTMPRHKSTNTEAEISYAKLGTLTEKEVK